ncbi:MAG: DUF3299 domain-containing protein [Planctomycetia bacterium]|nr:DUF3299 domain-containing protein [Planctomycetia bacterium]
MAPRLTLLSFIAVLCLALSGCGESHAGSAPQMPAPAVTAEVRSTEAVAKPNTAAPATAVAPPAPAAAGRIRDISFDTIKFPMTKNQPFKRSLITPQIEALAGQPVRIRGFILPSFKQHGLTQFVLVRDNMQCCFGPGAALYDCVLVEMDAGKSTDYAVRPVAVEGVFDIREVTGPDDKCLAIYHLQGRDVKQP